jgi:hypothetical protein
MRRSVHEPPESFRNEANAIGAEAIISKEESPMQQPLILFVPDNSRAFVVFPQSDGSFRSINIPTANPTIATTLETPVGQQAVSPPDKPTSDRSFARTIRRVVIALVALFVVGSIATGIALEPGKALGIIGQLLPIIEKIVDLVAHLKGMR